MRNQVTKRSRCLSFVKQNPLLLFTLVGVACGLTLGFAIRHLQPSGDALMWLGMPGQLYLRALKMMIVPLILSSVITGAASLDPTSNGRIGFVAFIYFYLTNLMGAILGIVAFLLFKPGEGGSYDGIVTAKQLSGPLQTQDVFADLLRNLIPDNAFEATFMQTQTKYLRKEDQLNGAVNGSNSSYVLEKTLGKGGGANILGILFVSLFIGMAISKLGEKAKPVYLFFDAATKVVLLVMRWFLRMTPVGVFSLILVPVASIPDVGVLFGQVGMFTTAVVVLLVVQQLLVMPLILFTVTRSNPFYHVSLLAKPWIIAFAAASTAVTIPEQLEICDKSLGVDRRVSRFTIPLGVTLSGNGPGIYIVCACLFISHLTGAPPTTATILIVGLLSSVMTLAAPAVPSSSLVTVILILTAMDIPTEPIALLLTVEFFLDRLRTTSEVLNNTMCAVITQQFCRGALATTAERIEEETEDQEDLSTIGTKSQQPEELPMIIAYNEIENGNEVNVP